MKKFLLWLSFFLILLGAGFTYILYSEGFFETQLNHEGDLKPFSAMKCEAGKCGGGKCSSSKKEMKK